MKITHTIARAAFLMLLLVASISVTSISVTASENSTAKRKLVPLGDHQYQAEMLIDTEASVLSLRVLDSKGERPISGTADVAVINLRRGKETRQYELTAEAVENAGDGNATPHFRIQHRLLVSSIQREAATIVFRVTINGRSYAGTLSHEHQH